ncbi:MAG TPA: DUF58 domain-containing protein [Steroidobacteraceae bacterium]|nr:DUF58 domain-containing protein [Steroidobacteraceae bacterium]
MGLRARATRAVQAWIRRRQGPDPEAVTLRRGRIYILPTGLGLAFGLMLVAMLLGSLNYANNLGLVLTFLLGALGVVAMHACHRNLESLVVSAAGTEPPFAGNDAVFRFALANPGRAPRCDLEAAAARAAPREASVAAGSQATIEIRVPTARRGSVVLERVEIATRFPYGLFRAWAVLHPGRACLVYPRPAAAAPLPPFAPAQAAGGIARRGEDDFAGLKDYHPGDPPRHIAWKAYARANELLVKEFSGESEAIPVFDLADAPGPDLEARLSVLARWIVDAHARGTTFGLRLPGEDISPEPGEAQRRRCLAAIARFEAPAPDVA